VATGGRNAGLRDRLKEFVYLFQPDRHSREILQRYYPLLAERTADFAERYYDFLFDNPSTARALYDYERDGGDLSRLVKTQLQHFHEMLAGEPDDEAYRIGAQWLSRWAQPAWVLGGYQLFLDHLLTRIRDSRELEGGDRLELENAVTRRLFLDLSLTLQGMSDHCCAIQQRRIEGFRRQWEKVAGVLGEQGIEVLRIDPRSGQAWDMCAWERDPVTYGDRALPLALPAGAADQARARLRQAWEAACGGARVACEVTGQRDTWQYHFFPTTDGEADSDGSVVVMICDHGGTVAQPALTGRTAPGFMEGTEDPLAQALESGTLQLYYQPEVDPARGEPRALEALLRWEHPQRGLVPAREFLALLNRSPSIHRLTGWVVERALADARGWWTEGRELPVAVNLAGARPGPELVASIRGALGGATDLAGRLRLELDQQLLFHLSGDGADAMLETLAGQGVVFGCDDFVAGYLPMAEFDSRAVRTVKVDPRWLPQDDGGAVERVLDRLVRLAHDGGRQVVLKWVEDEQNRDLAQRAGFDAIQGYQVAAPMPATEVGAWLQACRH